MNRFVESSRVDGVARITLNRPPLNVFSSPMLEEFTAAVTGASDAQVLVIGANGRVFCAGVDVAEHLPEKAPPMLALFHRACRRLLALDIPTVASVQGAALGGGCEVAMLCDFVIASRSATFGQPEIKVGAFPPVAAAVLAELVGSRRAMALMLLGEPIGAEAAQAAGLITSVVDDGHLEEATHQLVAKLTALSRSALSLAKRAGLAAFRRAFDEALDQAEQLYVEDLIRTEDAREGIMAFLEKRAPAWKHR